MRLSKKQQSIVEFIEREKSTSRPKVFEHLEGVIDDKKLHRSRYSSFSQSIRNLVEKGVLEEQDDVLQMATAETQNRVKNTTDFLEALAQLREHQQALTLSNLNLWMDIREWVWGMAQIQLSLPRHHQPKVIDFDQVLDSDPEHLERLMGTMVLDSEKIIQSGNIFSRKHLQRLQLDIHNQLKDNLHRFSISLPSLKSAIEAKYKTQPPSTTILEILEPIATLSDASVAQILENFESPYLREAASHYIEKMQDSHQLFQGSLADRFPGCFEGEWEWDRLFETLKRKIYHFAKSKGLYQSPEEWKEHLRSEVKNRFNSAQKSSGPAPRRGGSTTKTSCFQILGIEETDDLEKIRTVYRQLVKVHHPDQGGDPEFFRSLNLAYTTLVSDLE